MFIGLVTFLESKRLVFPYYYFCEELFFSGVIIAKLDPNQVKTEIYKLSLGTITSKGFGIFLTA